MYLTHMEMSLIKNSCRVRNFYAITEIVVNHRNSKENELLKKERRRIISPLRHFILSRKADRQVVVCMNAITDIQRTNKFYIKEAIGNFEEAVYELDMIGANITENPFNTLFKK